MSQPESLMSLVRRWEAAHNCLCAGQLRAALEAWGAELAEDIEREAENSREAPHNSCGQGMAIGALDTLRQLKADILGLPAGEP